MFLDFWSWINLFYRPVAEKRCMDTGSLSMRHELNTCTRQQSSKCSGCAQDSCTSDELLQVARAKALWAYLHRYPTCSYLSSLPPLLLLLPSPMRYPLTLHATALWTKTDESNALVNRDQSPCKTPLKRLWPSNVAVFVRFKASNCNIKLTADSRGISSHHGASNA